MKGLSTKEWVGWSSVGIVLGEERLNVKLSIFGFYGREITPTGVMLTPPGFGSRPDQRRSELNVSRVRKIMGVIAVFP